MSDNGTAAREQCHALFNNSAFADVVIAVNRLLEEASNSTVTTRKVAAALGLSDSVVRPVMIRLAAAALLGELPKIGPSNGPRLFHRRNGERWQQLCALIQSVGGAHLSVRTASLD